MEKAAQHVDYAKWKSASLKCEGEISVRIGYLEPKNEHFLTEVELEHCLLHPLVEMVLCNISSNLSGRLNIEHCKNRRFYRIYNNRSGATTAAIITPVKYGTDKSVVVSQTMEYWHQIKEEGSGGNVKVAILISEKDGEFHFTFILFPFNAQQGSEYLVLPDHQCTSDKLEATFGLLVLLTRMNLNTCELPNARRESLRAIVEMRNQEMIDCTPLC